MATIPASSSPRGEAERDTSDRAKSKQPEQLPAPNGAQDSSPFPSPTTVDRRFPDAPNTADGSGEAADESEWVDEPQFGKHPEPHGIGEESVHRKHLGGPGEVAHEAPRHHPSSLNSRTSVLPEGQHQSPTHRPMSVQFARDASDNEHPPELFQSPASSIKGEDADPASKGKHSIFSKLRSFAAPPFTSHNRSVSSASIGDFRPSPSDVLTPGSERGEFQFPDTLEEEGSDIDADAEESGAEQRAHRPKKRKQKWRRRRQVDSPTQTTPRSPGRPSFHLPTSLTGFDHPRPSLFPRRASASELHQHRDGVSEDEGRARLNRNAAWRRRRNTWLARGLTHGEQVIGHEERRPSNIRRLTGLGGPSEHADGHMVPWRRHKAGGGSSVGAQRWRQIKAGIKLIAQRRKPEHTVDYAKSAELLAELTSGVPAALILASMFQRDEHGSQRIPILLEQLKVRVTDSKIDSHSGDRHLIFKIELEYGSGITRMKWIIHRPLRDFANLHIKYRLHFGAQKYIQLRGNEPGHRLPRFPRGAFPYLRGWRGLEDESEDDEDETGYETGGEVTSGNERPGKKKKKKQRRFSGGLHRRGSSVVQPQEGEGDAGPSGAGEATPAGRKETYPERQRKKLEIYLQKMIRFLMFRPESNRLCKFLELSALGVRLAAEGTYHGKEGFLTIKSAKGIDFRRALTPPLATNRQMEKWFLIRQSYIVCVDSPEGMNIYDVFLVDPFFKLLAQKKSSGHKKAKELARSVKDQARHPKQHHTLRLENSERKLKLYASYERNLHQFEDSIQLMLDNTHWSKPHRFDSFAPVRQKCFAQWLVDARDHMWVVSRAISQAKDAIYIHDWWLSPELYMRRPPAISQKWRLDRLLQRKAQEGVKVFVIMYRNINSAIPIDSEYSKFSLLDLHPNIFVQRSPNQFRQNTFFWAHHEKLCLIDHTVAFVGGIDLCFGRWDTPQHRLTDDKPTGFETSDGVKDADTCQLWPGKDYSNPRVQDFYDLDKPYEEMYDRHIIPRMPWHDISMHVVGQPARDLTRHFVQRWNYILRQRKPTRPTPFLLPPPDFEPADLEALGLDGNCEVQILRSSSMWSTGTPEITEHSIMNAYAKLIEESEHFVYIENQFFVSSCEVDGRKIENLIGDALVERIIRAARNGETWRAVIVIPLMPGFQNTVDSEGGTSVRLIMQCQYRSVCRGETSLFGRLRSLGIEPEDYIQFFSLRTWAKVGPQKQIVTEQLYIHAKCMIVDDRAAIIGSANINERSMLGSRDSEVAAVVRDTEMMWSTMNGEPYLVGRFPHTLRMRLMREHLGIDVDELMEQEMTAEEELRMLQVAEEDARSPGDREKLDSETLILEKQDERDMIERRHRIQDEFLSRSEDTRSFNHDVDWEQADNPNIKTSKRLTTDPRVIQNLEHKKDVDGEGFDHLRFATEAGYGEGRDSRFLESNREALVTSIADEGKGSLDHPKHSSGGSSRRESDTNRDLRPESSSDERNSASPIPESAAAARTHSLSTNEGDRSSSHIPASREASDSTRHASPVVPGLTHTFVDKDCMRDPVNDIFYLDTWHAVAEQNTKIYRSVFRCMPDSEVKSWKEYKEYAAYGERFAEIQNPRSSKAFQRTPSRQTGPPGAGTGLAAAGAGLAAAVAPSIPESGHSGHADEKEKQPMGEKPAADEKSSNSPVDEKAELRAAADSSRGPSERPPLDAGKQEPLSSIEEHSVLQVPETPVANTRSNSRSDDGGAASDDLERPRSNSQSIDYSDALNLNARGQSRRRNRRTTVGSRRELQASDEVMDKQRAEDLLAHVQGHLILWPYDWFVPCDSVANLILMLTEYLGSRGKSKAGTGSTPWTRFLLWKYSESLPVAAVRCLLTECSN